MQHSNGKKLSSIVEKLLVTSELLHEDLKEMREALGTKPRKQKRKLVGVEVFMLEDLKKIEKEKEQTSKKCKKKSKEGKEKNAAGLAVEKKLRAKIMDEEIEKCIVVKLRGE